MDAPSLLLGGLLGILCETLALLVLEERLRRREVAPPSRAPYTLREGNLPPCATCGHAWGATAWVCEPVRISEKGAEKCT